MYAYVATWKIYPKKTGKMYTVCALKNCFICFVSCDVYTYFSYIISLARLFLLSCIYLKCAAHLT